MRSFGVALATALALWGAPARAEWYEASTDHFIVDADTSEARIRDFATRLERFHAALHLLYNVPEDPSRTSNRVHVYAVSVDFIQKMQGMAQGFYVPRAGGSVIFTSALSGMRGFNDIDAQAVLLHEYTHHFMYSNYPVAYPLWFSEGFAEFNANVAFQKDGSLEIGLPANYRAWGLFNSRNGSGATLTINELLEPDKKRLTDPTSLELIYGRGWLLTHYLTLNPQRRPQLTAYLVNMNQGMSSRDAAQKAFGDLNKLSLELAHYLAINRLEAPFLVPATAKPPTIEVHPLSAGAGAMMDVHMRSTAGVDAATARGLVPEAERHAADYPADPRVQVELAEAEFDAGRDAAADAAADRALTADPANQMAMLYKGRVAIRRLKTEKSRDADRWSKARAWFVKANRLDPNAAQPLILYFTSFMAEGREPPKAAVMALERAEMLAPEDPSVRWLLASYMLTSGDAEAARQLLQPIAYAPHALEKGNRAKDIVTLIDAGKIDEARKILLGDKANGESGSKGGGTDH